MVKYGSMFVFIVQALKSKAGCDHYLYNFNVSISIFLMEVTYLFFFPFFPHHGKNYLKTAVYNSVNKCLSNYREENWLLKKSSASSQSSNMGRCKKV